MNDPRRSHRFDPPLSRSGRAEPQSPWDPTYVDPAYADQAGYAPTYGGVIPQWNPNPWAPDQIPNQWAPNTAEPPTTRFPQAWQQNPPPPGGMPPGGLSAGPDSPPPQGPKPPRWLWVATVAAVVLVVALAIALVLANGPARDQTANEPLPPMLTPRSSAPTFAPTPPPTAPPSASAEPAPPTSGPGAPTQTIPPAGALSVVYNVSGEGRAISVMYMDTGDIMQTEFNVSLPWSKQVSLPRSSVRPASVTIFNIGHNVTCSVTVAGVQVSQRTGVGLTICQGTTN